MWWIRRRWRAEHPRVGGEDICLGTSAGVAGGTPPRRRGGREQLRTTGHDERNTPASAGRTRCTRRSPLPAAEHPRVGGEDVSYEKKENPVHGTPPRRRGGPPPESRGRTGRRNTPASAGRTTAATPRPYAGPEHPRVGGEDISAQKYTILPSGTPPRRRGGRSTRWGRSAARRNTPASAGRTTHTTAVWPPRTEHPRVGGEDMDRVMGKLAKGGTPPRRRGGRRTQRRQRLVERNTPASAGRTALRAGPGIVNAEHPRVGGEDDPDPGGAGGRPGTPPRRRGGPPQPQRDVHRRRNTPASAGRTPCGTGRTPRCAEHPRVGGEDALPQPWSSRAVGTPPRRRGGHFLTCALRRALHFLCHS